MSKSSTDLFWDQRAIQEQNSDATNIADVSQRQLETHFVQKHLKSTDSILEVGCGNGFLTNILRQQVKHVDAFDYSEKMVTQAIAKHGEKNNRFFHSNVLKPSDWKGPYDAIICVRVLINLRDLAEQKIAADHMTNALKTGGRLLLIEGYLDGFGELNRLREKIGIETLKPATINYYSFLNDMRAHLDQSYTTDAEFNSGCFDFLTRVVYPTLVGAQNATSHSDFHSKILAIAKSVNTDAFKPFARLHGYSLIKR